MALGDAEDLLILLTFTFLLSSFKGLLFIKVASRTLFSMLYSIFKVDTKATLDAADFSHVLSISRCTSLQFAKLGPIVVQFFWTSALSLMHENHKHWKTLPALIADSV